MPTRQNRNMLSQNEKSAVASRRHEEKSREFKMRSGLRHFTLIELLITVVIITILAAMLLPALNSARDTVYGSMCKSNMKSIGNAFAQYTVDFNDCLPPGTQYGMTCAWIFKLRDYLGLANKGPSAYWLKNNEGINYEVLKVMSPAGSSKSVYICPSASKDPGSYPMHLTYQTTVCADSAESAGEYIGGFNVFNTGIGTEDDSGRTIPKKISKIPSASVMLIEKVSISSGLPSDSNRASNTALAQWPTQGVLLECKYIPYGRHNGNTGNYLSLDGRVVSYLSAPGLGGRAVFNAKTWVKE